MVSIENYKTLSFPLAGLLSPTVRQYNLLYRVDKIRGVAVDAEGIISPHREELRRLTQ